MKLFEVQPGVKFILEADVEKCEMSSETPTVYIRLTENVFGATNCVDTTVWIPVRMPVYTEVLLSDKTIDAMNECDEAGMETCCDNDGQYIIYTGVTNPDY